jgi:hypothetical protein
MMKTAGKRWRFFVFGQHVQDIVEQMPVRLQALAGISIFWNVN